MRKLVLTAAVLAACGGVARADVLVDSGTPVGPDNLPEGRVTKAVYYDSSTGAGQFISQSFTLPTASLVTGIDSYFWAAPGVNVDVRLTSEIGPGATGADELAHFTLAGAPNAMTDFVASPPLAVALPAGTYYLVYSAPSANGAGFPDYAPTDIGDLTFANTLNGSTGFVNATNPAASGFYANTDEGDIGLREHGVVPEPGATALLLLATIPTLTRRRRR